MKLVAAALAAGRARSFRPLAGIEAVGLQADPGA